MKVLIIVPSLRRGGAERVVATLSRKFAAAHDARLVVFDSQDIAYTFGGTLIDLGLKPTRGTGKVLNVFRRAIAIKQQIKSFQPHLILSFTESANFPAIIAAKLAHTSARTYVSVRNNPSSFPWHIRLVGAMLYRFAGGVIGCSAGVSDAVKQAFRLSERRITTIVNPVDTDEGDSGAGDLFARYPNDKPYFVAVGRLDWQKGLDVLLKAWKVSRLADSHNLLVLGEGPLRAELVGLQRALRLKESVHFLGAVSSPFPIMQQAVGFVLSSRHEGWPNALAEAMSLGVPVISTNCEFGPSEIIRSEQEGLLVPVEDSEALATAMRLVSEDASLRERLAAGAKRRSAELSPQRIADSWLRLRHVAANSSGGAR